MKELRNSQLLEEYQELVLTKKLDFITQNNQSSKMIQFPESQCESTLSARSSEHLSSEHSTPSSGRNQVHDNYGIRINLNKLNRSSGRPRDSPRDQHSSNLPTETGHFGAQNKQSPSENLQLSKLSSKLGVSDKDSRQWKKLTLERFVFHLKQVHEAKNLRFLGTDQ